MFAQTKLFILLFAMVAVMGGQLFGVRGKRVCQCGPYTVPVIGLTCQAGECHDAAEHEDHHSAGSYQDEHEGDAEPVHHQPERLDLNLTTGLPGPLELTPVFLVEFAPMALSFGQVVHEAVVAASRLAQQSRWGPGAWPSCAMAQPLVVAEFTVLLI